MLLYLRVFHFCSFLVAVGMRLGRGQCSSDVLRIGVLCQEVLYKKQKDNKKKGRQYPFGST
jgi:hypothetical protein